MRSRGPIRDVRHVDTRRAGHAAAVPGCLLGDAGSDAADLDADFQVNLLVGADASEIDVQDVLAEVIPLHVVVMRAFSDFESTSRSITRVPSRIALKHLIVIDRQVDGRFLVAVTIAGIWPAFRRRRATAVPDDPSAAVP